jgi:hypothetical protein
VVHDKSLALTLELMQARLGLFEARLGLFERFGGAVALGADGGDLCAPVSIALAALLGFMFPLIATVFDFGKLAHHACSAHLRGRRPGSWSLIEMKMIA